MTYTLTATTAIIRDIDQACIPDDPRNTDYQAYLAWVAEGNTAAPYVAPTAPPLTCTPGQFDFALNAVGLLPAVQAYVATATDPRIGIAYNKATFFTENDSFITGAAQAMGKTTEDTHNLFILANTFNL